MNPFIFKFIWKYEKRAIQLLKIVFKMCILTTHEQMLISNKWIRIWTWCVHSLTNERVLHMYLKYLLMSSWSWVYSRCHTSQDQIYLFVHLSGMMWVVGELSQMTMLDTCVSFNWLDNYYVAAYSTFHKYCM